MCSQSTTRPSVRLKLSSMLLVVSVLVLSAIPLAEALNYKQTKVVPLRRQGNDSNNLPLIVTNNCQEDLYPAVWTQGGSGPKLSGFLLNPGASKNLTVSPDWQGRVWGRTNCSFNDDGSGPANKSAGPSSCYTGDCGGVVNCTLTGAPPATLAEFNMAGANSQSYYDISLVDGYNIPMAIVMLSRGNKSLEDIPPNLTNPSCQGTADLLAPTNYNPYSTLGTAQTFLGTNSSFPLPFVGDKVTNHQVSRWCPWPLQVNPPPKPGDGVYPYPDDNIQRPAFNPCLSACAKYNRDSDCCKGKYDSSSKCHPSEYSRAAKAVCPDAYSYAYDDATSTFAVPMGAGFEVVFCPGARSTQIIAKRPAADQVLQQTAHPTALNLTALPGGAEMARTADMATMAVAALAAALWAGWMW